jgi:hypothetical protein
VRQCRMRVYQERIIMAPATRARRATERPSSNHPPNIRVCRVRNAGSKVHQPPPPGAGAPLADVAGAAEEGGGVAPPPSGFFSGQPVRHTRVAANIDHRRSVLMGPEDRMERAKCTSRKAHPLLVFASMSDPKVIDPHDRMSTLRIGRDTLNATSLDQDRLASMADEGSVSGALMEMEDVVERKGLIENRRRPAAAAGWRRAAAAFVLAGVAIWVWGWWRRSA